MIDKQCLWERKEDGRLFWEVKAVQRFFVAGTVVGVLLGICTANIWLMHLGYLR